MKQAFVDQPCSRCGSKRIISKKWKEKVKTFTGTIIVDCAQIICTNKVCQKAFDKNLKEEKIKKEALQLKKDASDKERKENSLLHLALMRKQKTA